MAYQALCSAVILAAVSQTALAVPMLTNGGFETGDFTGWTQVTSNGAAETCQTDWYVSNTDTQCQFTNTILNSATEGDFAAYNSFDGGGPLNFTIEQDIVLGSVGSAALDFSYTVGWDFRLGGIATDQRIFSLSFLGCRKCPIPGLS